MDFVSIFTIVILIAFPIHFIEKIAIILAKAIALAQLISYVNRPQVITLPGDIVLVGLVGLVVFVARR